MVETIGVNINKFEAKLLLMLNDEERKFYETYIDYMEFVDDVWDPVLKIYFNEKDFNLEGFKKGLSLDETLKEYRAIKMIAKSLFKKMFGFSIRTKDATYKELKMARMEKTRLGKAMLLYEMLELKIEEDYEGQEFKIRNNIMKLTKSSK